MRTPTTICLVGLLCALFALPAPAAASSFGVGPLVPVSGPSPFRDGCAGPGSEATGAEAEPSLAVDPADPRHLVTTWQQDIATVGALSDVAAASFDGGRTWSQTRLPGISACDGGPAKYVHATDPWVSIGPKGVAWVASLPFTNANPGAVAVNRSNDGGRTWSPASFVDEDLLPTDFDDKETIAADPSDPLRAYVVWAKIELPPPPLPGASLFFTIYFSSTRDGGRTWSRRRALAYSAPAEGAFPQNIVAMPDGDLLVVYGRERPDNVTECINGDCPTQVTLYAVRSPDRGQTWSAPARIGAFHDENPRVEGVGTVTAPSALFSLAVGPTGTAWITTHTEPRPGVSRLLLFRSRDGGRSWSELPDIPVGQGWKLQPTIAASEGALAISWFDFRDDRPGDDRTDFSWWFAHSDDEGASWQEQRLAGPSDLRTAPGGSADIGDHFIGHYFGLTPAEGGFSAAFVQARPEARSGPTDLFAARITPLREAAGVPRIRLSIRPRKTRVGKRTRFRLGASVRRRGRRQALGRTLIRFAGRRLRTNSRGRALVVKRFRRPGLYRARACKRKYRCGTARVRVIG